MIIAAPVSDFSPALVDSPEIYAAAVGLTDTCSTQRPGHQHQWEAVCLSVRVMLGWMNIMKCHKKQEQVVSAFDILEQGVCVDVLSWLHESVVV